MGAYSPSGQPASQPNVILTTHVLFNFQLCITCRRCQPQDSSLIDAMRLQHEQENERARVYRQKMEEVKAVADKVACPPTHSHLLAGRCWCMAHLTVCFFFSLPPPPSPWFGLGNRGSDYAGTEGHTDHRDIAKPACARQRRGHPIDGSRLAHHYVSLSNSFLTSLRAFAHLSHDIPVSPGRPISCSRRRDRCGIAGPAQERPAGND